MFTHQHGLVDTIRFLLEDFTDANRFFLKGLVSQSIQLSLCEYECESLLVGSTGNIMKIKKTKKETTAEKKLYIHKSNV